MFLCLRVDLDYVPWDTPDAEAFGHGEPALLLKLLEAARASGHRFQFFVSNRVLRAFPASAEAVLNEGHDLDWFCKHPAGKPERRVEADNLFQRLGHRPQGFCLRTPWPEEQEGLLDTSGFTFLSAPPGPAPEGLTLFPVETKSARESIRSGLSARAWTDATKTAVRDYASRRRAITLVVRPQVLARFDAHLNHLREILDIAVAAGMPIVTLRQAMAQKS